MTFILETETKVCSDCDVDPDRLLAAAAYLLKRGE